MANPTLNINSTGAKSLNYRGVGVKSGYIGANSLVEVVYDGSQYNIVGDLTQSQVDNLQGVSGLKIQYGTATITTATSTTATTVNLADSFSSNPVVTVTVDAGTYWTDRIKVSANVLSPNSFTINHISTSEGTKFPVMWIAIGK